MHSDGARGVVRWDGTRHARWDVSEKATASPSRPRRLYQSMMTYSGPLDVTGRLYYNTLSRKDLSKLFPAEPKGVASTAYGVTNRLFVRNCASGAAVSA